MRTKHFTDASPHNHTLDPIARRGAGPRLVAHLGVTASGCPKYRMRRSDEQLVLPTDDGFGPVLGSVAARDGRGALGVFLRATH